MSTAILQPENWFEELNLQSVFESPGPIELDLGCGKGKLLLALAAENPEKNYIGVDRMNSRLNLVDERVQKRSLNNVKLLRVEAAYAVARLMPDHSVSAVYIMYPDPWPKRRHHNRRLFDPEFMDALVTLLEDAGCVHISTDHVDYFQVIYKLLQADPRFTEIEAFEPTEAQTTNFEIIFRNQNIPPNRCSFQKV